MKRLNLFLVILVVFGLVATSCKAAGGSSAKSEKSAQKQQKAAKSGGGAVKAGEITFKYIPAPGEEPETVNLAGSFQGWNPNDPNYALEKQSDGSFAITIELDPGKHQFKFVIDGNWIQSMEDIQEQVQPKPTGFVDDGFGGKNAVLELE